MIWPEVWPWVLAVVYRRHRAQLWKAKTIRDLRFRRGELRHRFECACPECGEYESYFEAVVDANRAWVRIA